VTQIIVGEALGVTVAGVIVGLIVAAMLARYLQSLLFEVSPFSVAAFAIVPIVFAAVAAASAYLPARRAMKVDPMVALRHE
jgi:ABC-type antimicrobial peptide transport system permease subunit